MHNLETSSDNRNEGRASLELEISSPRIEVHSVAANIEEVLPDGTKRSRSYTNQLEFKDGWALKARIHLPRWVILVFVAIIAIILGLMSVGPYEVWNWLTQVVDSVIQ